MPHPAFLRRCAVLLAGALLLAAIAAQAQGAGQGYAPLRPVSACLDPARARSWQMLDSSRLLVDAGRHHYLIELGWSCGELVTGQPLQFASRNPGGRICGDIGDAVATRRLGSNLLGRCDIARVVRLSPTQAAAELRARQPAVQPADGAGKD